MSDLTLPNARRVYVLGRAVSGYPEVPPEVERGTARRITEVGEAILSRPCRSVTEFGTPELATLVDDMFATMDVAEGVGLAANQIDVDLRVFVWDCIDDAGDRHVGHIVNPVLDRIPKRAPVMDGTEGCLSVPGAHAELARPDHAVVRGADLHGEPLVIEGTGYFARALQHESDHLDGHLYLDRLSRRSRKAALAEMHEQRDQVLARRAERTAGRPAAD